MKVNQEAKRFNRKLRERIYEVANSIEDFKHNKELTFVIHKKSLLPAMDKNMWLRGFLVMLNELKRDNTLQGETLLETMLNVKKVYVNRSKSTQGPYTELCYVTTAIAHMRNKLSRETKTTTTADCRVNHLKRQGYI